MFAAGALACRAPESAPGRCSLDLPPAGDDFEAEGNGFIAANLIREAEADFLPAIAAGRLSRHLYHVRL